MYRNPTFRSGRSRAVVALGAGLAMSLSMSPTAQATNSACGFQAKKNRVDFQIVTPSAVTLFVELDDQIKWKNTLTEETFDCAKATVNNTDQIWISDFNTAADAELTLDVARPFGPGASHESVGISEIEFFVDGGSGENELVLYGGNQSNRFAFGEEGVNLNKDSDDDVTMDDWQTFVLLGGGGNDVLSGVGGFGTGGPFALGLTVYGGTGHDTLSGSSVKDTLSGSAGRDKLKGGRGKDIVFGDAGRDKLEGGPGGDEIDGMSGNDTLLGQGGPDDLEGGEGTDTCKGGPGADNIATCELP